MRHHRKVLVLHLPERMGFVNLTRQVEQAVRDSGVQEGLCLVNAMHITASVFINDEEEGLKQDYARWLENLAPFNPGSDPGKGGYLHNQGAPRCLGLPRQKRATRVAFFSGDGEDNGDAHHRGSVSAALTPQAAGRGRTARGAVR